MVKLTDIYWVAGILEGEAHFGVTNAGTHPIIQLMMTDRDVVARVRDLLNKEAVVKWLEDRRKTNYKDLYRISIHGHHARGWLMTIYPLMSKRRQQKIRELITDWKTSPSREIDTSDEAKQRAMIRRLARKECCSFSIAKHRLMLAGMSRRKEM